MHSELFVSKIKTNIGTVYLKLQWKQNDFNLFNLQMTIFDYDEKSWSGVFSNDQAQTFIDELYQSKDDYHANAKTCLIGEGGDEYKLDVAFNNDGSAEFCWKKRYKGFFQVQGSMKLSLDANSVTKTAVINLLIEQNKILRSTCKDQNKKLDLLNAELGTHRSELEKYVNIKDAVESILYGKFVQLLNTKKRRIQLLEAQLDKYESKN